MGIWNDLNDVDLAVDKPDALSSTSRKRRKTPLLVSFLIWKMYSTRKFAMLWKKKTYVLFFVFHLDQLMNALVYVDIDQGICKGKMKVALNEKQKKVRGFSFSINMANFEAFLSVFKLTKNPLFLKSVV